MTGGGRLVVVGSMNLDLTVRTTVLPQPGSTVLGSDICRSPGGKSSNQAAVAALMGADVSLVAAVGSDPEGHELISQAQNTGIDTTHVRVIPSATTGVALIAVDDAAENLIIVSPGANTQLTSEHVRSSLEAITEVSAVSLCLEIPLDVVRDTVIAASAHGVTVILNLSPYSEGAAFLAAMADLVIVNEHEAAKLCGIDSLLDISDGELSEKLDQLGVHRAVITLGAEGALVIDSSAGPDRSPQRVPTPRVRAMDTTGCGDAFAGVIASEIAAGAELVSAARTAAGVAAYAAQYAGAQPSYPTRDRFNAWLSDREGGSHL
ncbi:ribokinase [Streptosporangium sp. 'caverna']|uniref:ribokinase n=1 Tax=Streptosporangium sp. 'caverna' TaxID=2202249 RepID=UPI000D7EA501|nr:ribokinase [Streptosporangium sp. 'caverna']AWS46119.1 ribokinase [Streptosporangium sp. 'caverna']